MDSFLVHLNGSKPNFYDLKFFISKMLLLQVKTDRNMKEPPRSVGKKKENKKEKKGMLMNKVASNPDLAGYLFNNYGGYQISSKGGQWILVIRLNRSEKGVNFIIQNNFKGRISGIQPTGYLAKQISRYPAREPDNRPDTSGGTSGATLIISHDFCYIIYYIFFTNLKNDY